MVTTKSKMPISSSKSPSFPSAGSITDRAAQFISKLQSGIEKRDAIRHKVAHILGHKFEGVFLREPTYCSQCRDLIWGLIGQSCKLCKLASHKKCLDLVNRECMSTVESTRSNIFESHKFVDKYFKTPTFCNHCGNLLKGVLTKSQGLKCDLESGGCGMNVHRECKMLIGHLCDVGNFSKISRQTGESLAKDNLDTDAWSKVRISDFELIRLLGTGGFSKVYLARLKTNEQEFAIKVIKKTTIEISGDPESALTEKKVLHFGRSYPFLTIAHCCFHSKERLYFVMECVIGRDLVYHLRKARKFTEDRARFHSAEIVLALRYLHRQGVVYRDLKLDNVMLDQHGHCKLLDFGMSKELTRTANMTTRTFCGTPSYISPEIIRELDYNFSVDWWSLGVMMHEMLIGCSPFEAQNTAQLYRSIIEEEIRYPAYLSDEARSILEGLLTKDPQIRLGCHILEGCDQAILEHPFFLFRSSEDGMIAHQWDAIEAKRMKPPYRPQANELDPSDDLGTECPSLTPISSDQLKKISQTGFERFSFYSESFNQLNSISGISQLLPIPSAK